MKSRRCGVMGSASFIPTYLQLMVEQEIQRKSGYSLQEDEEMLR